MLLITALQTEPHCLLLISLTLFISELKVSSTIVAGKVFEIRTQYCLRQFIATLLWTGTTLKHNYRNNNGSFLVSELLKCIKMSTSRYDCVCSTIN